MNNNPFDGLSSLWTLTLPLGARAVTPYIARDGGLEFFTVQDLAQACADRLAEQRIRTDVRQYRGREEILAFIRRCMHDGMLSFRMNNGSGGIREYRFEDLFDYHEKYLVEEMNRSTRCLLLRGKLYGYYRSLLPREEQSAQAGVNLASLELTMVYNAYRSMYRGVLYALAAPVPHCEDLDCYTKAALDVAKGWLGEKSVSEAGYRANSLIRTPHQGGMIYSGPLKLFYVHGGGEPGVNMVCAFTSFAAAADGRNMLFGAADDPSKPAVVAVTAPELIGQAMTCDGVLIDMGSIEYMIGKDRFGEWQTYGGMDKPIIVNLKTGARQAAPDGGEGGNGR